MTVAPCIGKPLEEQQSDALAPPGAVRVVRERLAPPVGGEPALPAEVDERGRGGHHGHTAGQRQ